jgi:2-aminoadipate transaminase
MAVVDSASLESLLSRRLQSRTDLRLPGAAGSVRYDFGQGLPAPESYPRTLIGELAVLVLEKHGAAALDYFDPQGGEREMVMGYPGLRARIAAMTNDDQGTAIGFEDVMLVGGSMDGLASIASAFIDPGDGVVVEAVSYHRPVQFMRSLGAEVSPVPLDDYGLDPDDVEDRLRRLRARGSTPKLVYTIPTFHSPLGVTLSLERRRRLVELAATWDIVIIEDNVYGRLRYEGDPVPTMASLPGSQRVIYVDSFSKTIAPALRMAWISASQPALRAIEAVRTDLGVSQYLARLIEEFLAGGHFGSHLRDVNALYKAKRDEAVDALERHLSPWATWRVPEGSMYLWVELQPGIEVAAVVEGARRFGVTVRPGSLFSVQPGWADQAVRLCFGRVPLEDIPLGIEQLGRAVTGAAEES